MDFPPGCRHPVMFVRKTPTYCAHKCETRAGVRDSIPSYHGWMENSCIQIWIQINKRQTPLSPTTAKMCTLIQLKDKLARRLQHTRASFIIIGLEGWNCPVMDFRPFPRALPALFGMNWNILATRCTHTVSVTKSLSKWIANVSRKSLKENMNHCCLSSVAVM